MQYIASISTIIILIVLGTRQLIGTRRVAEHRQVRQPGQLETGLVEKALQVGDLVLVDRQRAHARIVEEANRVVEQIVVQNQLLQTIEVLNARQRAQTIVAEVEFANSRSIVQGERRRDVPHLLTDVGGCLRKENIRTENCLVRIQTPTDCDSSQVRPFSSGSTSSRYSPQILISVSSGNVVIVASFFANSSSSISSGRMSSLSGVIDRRRWLLLLLPEGSGKSSVSSVAELDDEMDEEEATDDESEG